MATFTLSDDPFGGDDDGGGGGYTYNLIPEDSIIRCKVNKVVVESPPWDKEGQERVNITLEVVEEGPNKGDYLWANCLPFFNSKANCRLRLWVEEICSVEGSLPVDFELDTDFLIDMEVNAVINNYWSAKKERTEHGVSDLRRVAQPALVDSDSF